MAWIKLEQTIRDHRKVIQLAEALMGGDEAKALGHLAYLWLWSLDNAPNGVLDMSPAIIARAAKWPGDADVWLDTLARVGFLERTDDDMRLHDWHEYAGRLLDERERRAEKMRAYRKRSAAARAADNAAPEEHVPDTVEEHVTGTVKVHVPVTCALRVEKSREEKSRVEESGGASPLPPVNDEEPTLPPLLAGDRFPLTRALAAYSWRHYRKPLLAPTSVQVRVVSQYEGKLGELAELARAMGRGPLAPVDDRCLQEYWRNQLQGTGTHFTATIFSKIIVQAINDLSQHRPPTATTTTSAAPHADLNW